MARGILLTLARRFTFSKRSDGFLSFIAWISVLGVAVGVLALVVVMSVINGFQGEMARSITSMNGDVILYTQGNPVGNVGEVLERIHRVLPDAREVTPSFVSEMMLSGPHAVSGAVVQGFESDTFGRVTEVPKRVQEGQLPVGPGEVALGSALAEKVGVRVGESVRLIAPFVGEKDNPSAMGGAPKSIELRVVGIVKMGLYQYDSKFTFVRLADLQEFLGQKEAVTTFQIKLPSSSQAEVAARRLSEVFGPPFRVRDWGRIDKNIFEAIAYEKVLITTILAVIVLVAAFNVVSTLMMMIHDKTREIAILKAMGFRPSQSFNLFLWIGMGIGTVGVALGVGLGMAVNAVLSRTKLIHLPADVYRIEFLPVVVRSSDILMICGLAVLICFVATLYPAISVSRRSPLEGMRNE